MKYPFRRVQYEVVKVAKRSKEKWTVKTLESGYNIKGERVTVSWYRFPLFTTEEEAKEYYEIIKDYKYLATDANMERHITFRQFYGCNNCGDALTSKLETPDDYSKSQAMFCTNKTCPYAEEIEKYGGYPTMLAKMREDGLYNFNFGDSYLNNWFGRW